LTRFRAGASRTRTESFATRGPLGASVIVMGDVWATPFEGVVPPEGKPGHKTAREIRRRRMWLRKSMKIAADSSLVADVPWTGFLVEGGGTPLARISAGIGHNPVPESKKRKRGQCGFGSRWSRINKRADLPWAPEQGDGRESSVASPEPPSTPPVPDHQVLHPDGSAVQMVLNGRVHLLFVRGGQTVWEEQPLPPRRRPAPPSYLRGSRTDAEWRARGYDV